jgi:hypothetical protein
MTYLCPTTSIARLTVRLLLNIYQTAMNNKVKLRLSQSWQVPQKADKNGKTYPPLAEKLELEVEVSMDEVASTYTMLNAELFKARVTHMKGLKQRAPIDNMIRDL